MKTAILTLAYPTRASYYEDWRDAFSQSALFRAEVVNLFFRAERRRVARLAREVDLIVLLHACTADSLAHVEPITAALQDRRAPLVCFVGNELNMPGVPMAAKIAWLEKICPDLIATQLLEEAGAWLYQSVGSRVISLPHAVNPMAYTPGLRQDVRPVDIGARSFRYSPFIGDDDRNRIFDAFARGRFDPPLVLDMSNDHRFDRAGWARFLQRCKGTVSTEAGSWYLEHDDRTVRAVATHLRNQAPAGVTVAVGSPMHRLAQRLPYPLKAALRWLMRWGPVRFEAMQGYDTDPVEIFRQFFSGTPRCPVYSKCISSRHFDAIGTGTVQIMFPGRFNDILVADEHYLALSPDLANIDEVLARFRDPSIRSRIVQSAIDLVMSNHTYAHRLQTLARQLG